MAQDRVSDFTYRGIHIGSLGVHYVPERKDWHIWESDYKTSDTTNEAQDGGQWDGFTVEPKEFNLRLYFTEITEHQLTNAISLFEKGANGELIFDERPWLVYKARVVKKVDVEKYPAGNGNLSGFLTVHLTAYYPYALCLYNTLNDNSDPLLAQKLKDTTALLDSSKMPTNTTGNKTAQFIYNAYNGGNAWADTVIKIAGDVGTGVDIYNMQTGQYCRVVKLTTANSTTAGKWLEIYSRTGECWLTNGSVKSNGYVYHDRGYIQLKHGTPLLRDISMTYNTNTLSTLNDTFMPTDVGRYLNIGGTWHEIMSVTNSKTAVINPPKTGSGTISADMTNVNRLVVTPLSTMNLTRFEVVSKHTFE